MLVVMLYEGCSESNAFYLMLAHDVKGRCSLYGSRGWTFPPISHYILLPCDRQQQRCTLTEWYLTWHCGWCKTVSLNSFTWKKKSPLTLTDTCWMFMETNQWMWAQWGGGWSVSAVVTMTVTSTGTDYYECGMQALVHCWQKCIINGDDYVEK